MGADIVDIVPVVLLGISFCLSFILFITLCRTYIWHRRVTDLLLLTIVISDICFCVFGSTTRVLQFDQTYDEVIQSWAGTMLEALFHTSFIASILATGIMAAFVITGAKPSFRVAIPVSIMDSFLRPVFISKGLETPMLVILIGVLGGMMAYGLIGIFMGPVLFAVFYELFKVWIDASPAADDTAEGAAK